MPEPVVDQEIGQLLADETYANARYDMGYRMGWKDAHRKARPAHSRTRDNHEEYAKGYSHGFEDGKGHPCPEWDDAHRLGPLRELPPTCPWKAG